MPSLFGEKNAEDQAADKVKDAADSSADTIGDAREKMSDDNDKSLLETVKDKLSDAVEYTKEAARSAKESAEEMFMGGPVMEERHAPTYNPRENIVKSKDLFHDIRDHNEDTDLPHSHDY